MRTASVCDSLIEDSTMPMILLGNHAHGRFQHHELYRASPDLSDRKFAAKCNSSIMNLESRISTTHCKKAHLPPRPPHPAAPRPYFPKAPRPTSAATHFSPSARPGQVPSPTSFLRFSTATTTDMTTSEPTHISTCRHHHYHQQQ